MTEGVLKGRDLYLNEGSITIKNDTFNAVNILQLSNSSDNIEQIMSTKLKGTDVSLCMNTDVILDKKVTVNGIELTTAGNIVGPLLTGLVKAIGKAERARRGTAGADEPASVIVDEFKNGFKEIQRFLEDDTPYKEGLSKSNYFFNKYLEGNVAESDEQIQTNKRNILLDGIIGVCEELNKSTVQSVIAWILTLITELNDDTPGKPGEAGRALWNAIPLFSDILSTKGYTWERIFNEMMKIIDGLEGDDKYSIVKILAKFQDTFQFQMAQYGMTLSPEGNDLNFLLRGSSLELPPSKLQEIAQSGN